MHDLSPPPEGRAPVQAGAEAGGEQEVAAADAALPVELVERDRDRAGRGVAVPLEVLEDGVAVESPARRSRRG